MEKKKHKFGRTTGGLIFFICLMIIPVLHTIVFYFIVNFNSFRMAFQTYDRVTQTIKGFTFDRFGEVYHEIFGGGSIGGNWDIAFKNCYLLWILGLVAHTPVNFFISYFLYKNEGVGDWFKVALFAPTMVSSLVTLLMFKYFANEALPRAVEIIFGIPNPGGYLRLPGYRFWTMWIHGFFTGFGSGMLIYVNAMKAISVSVVEAAKLDGVGFFSEFIHITFPIIFSTWRVYFVLGIAGILGNQFGCFPLYGTSAPPDVQTVGYNLFVWSSTMGEKYYPFLSAFGMCISVITLIPTLFFRWFTNKIDPMN